MWCSALTCYFTSLCNTVWFLWVVFLFCVCWEKVLRTVLKTFATTYTTPYCNSALSNVPLWHRCSDIATKSGVQTWIARCQPNWQWKHSLWWPGMETYENLERSFNVLDGIRVQECSRFKLILFTQRTFLGVSSLKVSMTSAGFLQIEQHYAAKPREKRGGGTHHAFE